MAEEKMDSKGVVKFNTPADFAKLQKLILLDLKNYPYQHSSRFIGKYRHEDIAQYLAMPEIFYNQIQLRYISKYLFNVSSHYRRLIQYFAMILTFDYVVEPYALDIDKVDKKKFKKAYQKAMDLVENMNIKHEFQKLILQAFREDVFYGYVHQSKDSFFIQPLNPDFCKVSSVVDGVYNFAFDFNYFNTYPNRIYMFPVEFQEKFQAYTKDGSMRWQELSTENTICIKINEDLEYAIPPFVGIFGNLLDIQDFKDLEKQRQEIGNYKMLVQKIPVRDNSLDVNDYLITLDHVNMFHENVSEALPRQIGLITSPMEIDEIDFTRDHPDINQVEQATSEFWDASGVSKLLFSGQGKGASGSTAMGNSIRTDEVVAFAVLRQLERWLNRYMKNFNSAQYKFRVNMLNTTVFNKQDVFNQTFQSATVGMPVKTQLFALLGKQPSALSNMMFLENEILELHMNLIPLASSHTQSGDGSPNGNNSGGRPKKSEDKLTDEGLETREKDKNANSKT